MYKNNRNMTPAPSTYIRTFYSKEFSYLMMSFFKANLSIRLAPYAGKDGSGRHQYHDRKGLTTTFGYEGAFYLYHVAMSILNGENPDESIEAVLSCNNATITLEYKPDQNNQMTAYLKIEKSNETVTFRFGTHTSQKKRKWASDYESGSVRFRCFCDDG